MTDIVAASSSRERAQGMLCPVCRVDLLLSDRQGIEIDYCPQCRGVWLDRGELDKIIERNATFEAGAAPQVGSGMAPGPGYAQPGPWNGGHGDDRHGGGHGRGHSDGGHGGGHHRGGFLGGLFR